MKKTTNADRPKIGHRLVGPRTRENHCMLWGVVTTCGKWDSSYQSDNYEREFNRI